MMKLEAPERDVPARPAVLRPPPAALPGPAGLIVHDTGTRGWRRRLLDRPAADRLRRVDIPGR